MDMNLNPLATAGLVMIGLSQVSQAWTALQPTPQETHFRVVEDGRSPFGRECEGDLEYPPCPHHP